MGASRNRRLKRVGPVLFDVVKVHLGLRKITRKKVGNEELE
jgi:hypothetical protein